MPIKNTSRIESAIIMAWEIKEKVKRHSIKAGLSCHRVNAKTISREVNTKIN